MRQIGEVLRLAAQGCSYHEISRSVGISSSTVHNYLARARQAGLSWPLPADLDAAALEARLFVRDGAANRAGRPVPDGAAVPRRRRRGKHVTLQLLWLDRQDVVLRFALPQPPT